MTATSHVHPFIRSIQAVPEMMGESPAMQHLRERLGRLAVADDAPILIRGEAGVGKDMVARAIHAASPRANLPFVIVRCADIPAALPEGFFDQELGLAEGGTLFIDEISALGLRAQAHLLRALLADVRMLAATRASLPDEIEAGRFRLDLYYRLGVGEIEVPPLRDRPEDVVPLAEEFLRRVSGSSRRSFTLGARTALRAYVWPGNVRQLRNEVERAAMLTPGAQVDLEDLQALLSPLRSARARVMTLAR